MPDASQPLKNARHERFALCAAKEKSAVVAYRRVYGKASAATAGTEGPRLRRDPQISLRIKWLKDKAAAKATDELGITRGKWANRFLDIADKVEKKKLAPAAAAAATNALRQVGLSQAGWYAPANMQVVAEVHGEVIVEIGGS